VPYENQVGNSYLLLPLELKFWQATGLRGVQGRMLKGRWPPSKRSERGVKAAV